MKTSFTKKVAILLFANSPEEDMRRKSLYDSKELFEDLSRRSLSTAGKTGLTYIHIDEQAQRGSDFGERFANAILDVFGEGFEYVITIGNDSPGLKSAHILEALGYLKDKKVVLGPSADGGFYLMGLHRSQFSKQDFTQLPWQTSGLLGAFTLLIKNKGVECHRLNLLADLDNWEDFLEYARSNKNVPYSILLYISKNISSVLSPVYWENDKYFKLLISTHYNKGSPLLIPTSI